MTTEAMGETRTNAPRIRQGNGVSRRSSHDSDREVEHETADERLANALGWFSIGLGVAEVAAPGAVARLIGVQDDARNHAILRTMGVREIAAGVGILTQPRPAGWLWARVAGDVMDLALLGTAMTSDDANRPRVAAATAAVLGVTALDIVNANRLASRADGALGRGAKDPAIRLKTAVTVEATPAQVYQFWRDFQNLPRFMSHLESVRMIGGGRSHWTAKGPLGLTAEWDAEIVDEQPDSLIAWRSLEGSEVHNEGTVRFERAPGDRGTYITLSMHYSPPGGVIGEKIASLFKEVPKVQMQNDLRRLKQVIETGEVVQSDASIHRGPHPARPADHTDHQ